MLVAIVSLFIRYVADLFFFQFLHETDSFLRSDPILYIILCLSMPSLSLVAVRKLRTRPPEMNGAAAHARHAIPPRQP